MREVRKNRIREEVEDEKVRKKLFRDHEERWENEEKSKRKCETAGSGVSGLECPVCINKHIHI